MFLIYRLIICSTWWQRTKKTVCSKHLVLKQILLITTSWKSMNMKWNITFTFERVEAVKVCILTSFYSQAGITHNTVMHLAIFHVFPIQIVGLLEINKRVYRFIFTSLTNMLAGVMEHYSFFSPLFFQVFGNGVTDVVLSQGVIVVSYSNKSVRLYSFEHVVQRVCSIRADVF